MSETEDVRAEEWPKVVSDWTHNGVRWRINDVGPGHTDFVRDGAESLALDAAIARIRVLESERARLERERDELKEKLTDEAYRVNFPAIERQDGERPSDDPCCEWCRMPGQLGVHTVCSGCWGSKSFRTRVSPPLTARSSDATVSEDEWCDWCRDPNQRATLRFCQSCADEIRTRLGLLPARSSAEGERDKDALDHIEHAYALCKHSDDSVSVDLLGAVDVALRQTGRLASKERSK